MTVDKFMTAWMLMQTMTVLWSCCKHYLANRLDSASVAVEYYGNSIINSSIHILVELYIIIWHTCRAVNNVTVSQPH